NMTLPLEEVAPVEVENKNIDFNDYLNKIDLNNLDLTTDEVDLSNVDELLKSFQDNSMVQEALNKNVNLQKYSKEIESQLYEVEINSIKDYVENSDDLVKLHDQINSCDNLLENMQKTLSNFQDHLKNI